MQCERLIGLIKSWYRNVQDETMAPARMVMFIEQHAERCDVCFHDPDLKDEIAKITEMILPESKIPKAARKEQDEEHVEEDVAEEHSEEQGGDNNVEEEEEYSDFDEEDDEL